MKSLLKFLFSATALLLSTVAVAANSEELIQSKEDFLEFAANVSDGNNFEGTTVLLRCNVDLKDETFAPIGNADGSTGFAGTFDGQGHVISNLVIEETTYPYAGLFRTLGEGGIVRNVVLDGSCSVKSTVAPTTAGAADVYVGGIVGSVIGTGSVEDCVSVARVEYNVSSSDAASGNAHIGGIAGSINGGSASNLAEIVRCANYGSVMVGVLPSNVAAHLGGVVGTMGDISVVQNSLNSGSIACGSATATTYVGGLVGSVSGTNDMEVKSSVSNGAITAATGSNVGAIAGNAGGGVFSDNHYSNTLGVSDTTSATSMTA